MGAGSPCTPVGATEHNPGYTDVTWWVSRALPGAGLNLGLALQRRAVGTKQTLVGRRECFSWRWDGFSPEAVWHSGH